MGFPEETLNSTEQNETTDTQSYLLIKVESTAETLVWMQKEEKERWINTLNCFKYNFTRVYYVDLEAQLHLLRFLVCNFFERVIEDCELSSGGNLCRFQLESRVEVCQ